jgi:ectoine hydroxylase-related dioxygenase (phytanoyl-CoA dioxygenase family)
VTLNRDQLAHQLSDDGFCIIPNVLSPEELAHARAALDRIVLQMRQRGIPTHVDVLDPNESNIRLHNLPELDPLFVDLLRHPTAVDMVAEILGPHFIISNFTGNIALPGSGSMRLHSDQALAVPPPWLQPWAANIIWCIDDVHSRNGATRYVPGSHHYRTFEDVPPDAASATLAFEAPAGSAIVMEGRLWHTSGANITDDERRAMLFAYYSADFVRQQVNWEVALSSETKERFDSETRARFGLGRMSNARIGAELTRLPGH